MIPESIINNINTNDYTKVVAACNEFTDYYNELSRFDRKVIATMRAYHLATSALYLSMFLQYGDNSQVLKQFWGIIRQLRKQLKFATEESTYSVTVKETLQRTVQVKADSMEDASAKVEEMWYNQEIILTADDFTTVSFVPEESI